MRRRVLSRTMGRPMDFMLAHCLLRGSGVLLQPVAQLIGSSRVRPGDGFLSYAAGVICFLVTVAKTVVHTGGNQPQE
jgi:hypothetical protein